MPDTMWSKKAMELTERRGAQADGTGYEVKMTARDVWRKIRRFWRSEKFSEDNFECIRKVLMKLPIEIKLSETGIVTIVPLHHRRGRGIVDGTLFRSGIMPMRFAFMRMVEFFLRVLVKDVYDFRKQSVVVMMGYDRMSQYHDTGKHD